MEDSKLDNVIKGISCHISDPDGRLNCDECPFKRAEMSNSVGCLNRLHIDALELLKRKKGSWDYGTQCSVCKGAIIPPQNRKTHINFCPWCGADMRDSYK